MMISEGKQSRLSALIRVFWLRKLISRGIKQETIGRIAQIAKLFQNCQLASSILVALQWNPSLPLLGTS